MTLEDPQPETAHLVEADVRWVAYWIAESHNSEFLEWAPRAATARCDYCHPPCCLLNPLEMTDALPYTGLLCSPHCEFCLVHYSLAGQVCLNGVLYGGHNCFIQQLLFVGNNSIQCTSCQKGGHRKCSRIITGSMYKVMKSFVCTCRGCVNPVMCRGRTSVDTVFVSMQIWS